ncbi:MAG: hypothetical protein CMJ32_00140 [Phycisphaerae bacterium]|nr:hypothetical protein [Phycisphaerae bacterium]
MTTIIDSGKIMEAEGMTDPEDEFADMTATTEPDEGTMNFHVQMRGYTMSDFETMVVHAAATQLLGGRSFQSEIKAEAANIASEKVSRELSTAMKDVMSLTVAKRGNEDVTLSKMIGMEAKDYLTQLVDGQGKPTSGGWGHPDGVPRVQYLAGQYLRENFAKEITEALKAARDDVKAEVSRKIDAAISEERKKIADALGYELKKSR